MRFRVYAPGRITAAILAIVLLPCATRCQAQSLYSWFANAAQQRRDSSEQDDASEPRDPEEISAPEESEDPRPVAGSLLPLADSVLNDTPPLAERMGQQASWRSLSGWSNRTPGAAVCRPYELQMLPQGLMYHAYVAGEKEPRIGLSILNDPDIGTIWDAALGGRMGIIRYGTRGAVNPEGWQIDMEGAALPRIDTAAPSAPLQAVDYRFGIQWTRRQNGTALKAGYYHISSHLGDEFLLNNPGFVRLNYVRDSLVFGVTRDLGPDWQGYGEIGYALGADGGAEPLEFQFGLQYDQRDRTNLPGAPFAAVNVHLRQEVDFGGGINVLAGWRWRGAESNHVLRVGLQFYNGKAIQYSFFRQSEQFAGGGVWFDY